ncbi:hypothetical protein D3C87_1511720 [compost metagenome]
MLNFPFYQVKEPLLQVKLGHKQVLKRDHVLGRRGFFVFAQKAKQRFQFLQHGLMGRKQDLIGIKFSSNLVQVTGSH